MAPRKRQRASGSASPASGSASPASGSASPASGSASPLVTLNDESSLGAKLSAFRKAGTLTDVTICAGGERFPAHRNVLAASSDYLAALFASGMRDSESDVALQDVPANIFSALLDFVYEGTCVLAEPLLPNLLVAAAMLQVLPLQEAVLEVLKGQVGAATSRILLTVQFCVQLYTDRIDTAYSVGVQGLQLYRPN